MKTFFRTLSLFALLLVSFISPTSVIAQDEPQLAVSDAPIVYIFGRDDCGFCKAELAWLEESETRYIYLNIITNETAKAQWNALAEKHGLSKVTPITVVGSDVFVGFAGAETTGKAISAAIEKNRGGGIYTPEEHLANAPSQQVSNEGSCTDLECEEANSQAYVFDLPFVGIVDLKSFSLITLSLVLGTIDGFNPCAMWVLITFLVLLSQAGSKKKMVFLAGIFIVAEAIMYNLILNVWYQVWDFVALDQIVTPLVGLLALGGGAFFLYRWQKNKEVALVCDISDLETQSKTISRFEAIARQPLTLATVAAIIVIAFSVNIIEFACSIGIPQAYTKILDLNALTFIERQFYIMMYTLGYMVDDFLVFGLAIWGYGRLEAHGHRYAQLSLLIGGALMLVLGLMLVFNPDLLVIG